MPARLRAAGDDGVDSGAVEGELPGIPDLNVFLESEPRDSTAAIGLAAAVLLRREPDVIIGSFAADHVIRVPHLFDWAVRSRRDSPDLPGPFPPPARFRIEVPDAVLDRAVLPLVDVADRPLSRMRALQRGPVQMYLLYVLLAVVGVLLVAR